MTPGEKAHADQLALRERIRAKHAARVEARPTGGGRTVPTLDARERERVEGHAKVQWGALKQKLSVALPVWLMLVKYRDRSGYALVDARRIARAQNLPLRTVENHLAKLREAGLVSGVKWRLRAGARAGVPHARTHAPYRRVLGTLPATSAILYACVPEATLRWVETERRGGKRPGAGRPKGAKDRTPRQQSNMAVPPLSRKSNMAGSTIKHGGGSLFSDLSTRSSLSQEKERPRGVAPRGCSPFSERDEGGEAAELPTQPAPSSEPAVLAHVPSTQKVPLTVDVLNAARERVRPAPRPEPPDVSDEAWRALPSLRLSVASFAPSVPSPPKLDPDDPIERQVFLLAEWYRGAVHAKYGVRPFLGRGPLTPTSKHWKTLARIAPLFVEHDIAPAAWVAVSLGLYEEHARKLIEEKASAKKGRKKRVSFPALGWVYSMSRMTATRWQYRQHGGDFQGSTVQYTPACRALIVALQRLRDLVDFERPQTAEHAQRLVDRAFPDESHAELLARAKAESRAAQADILHGVACGRWMWLL